MTNVIDSGDVRPETPVGLRLQAERVRRLARHIAHDEAAPQLRAFADELEARARLLDQGGAGNP